jgi:phospho-N-acetylmuramoyl-pentapeptide-transferase
MLSYLSDLEASFGPLRIFGSLVFRALFAGVTALMLGFLIAPRLFAKLRLLKASQSLRTKDQVGALADLHASKSHTPTMGGLMICVSVVASVVLWARPNVYVYACLLVYLGLTVIGFSDDYLKVTKKSSAGLPGRLKLIGQAVLAGVVLLMLAAFPESSRSMWVPFYGEAFCPELPLFVLILFFFMILVGSSNAVNLTDGVDGLAIGCTITTMIALAVMAFVAGMPNAAELYSVSHVPGSGELAVVCCAVLGASIVFLWYNSHPAEVFMGDTGSLGLGGLIGTVAFMIHQPFTLIIIGGVFVMEAGSVILQVGSYKLRKKRIFKMSPIHHHFELLGWHENKVVVRFWILSLIFAIIGLSTLVIH